MAHRKYRTSLDQVEDAFRACWKTAQQHVAASKVLKESDLHAQALSLAVLAIEELGKLFCVDGLLFARADDGRAKAFAKAQRDHRVMVQPPRHHAGFANCQSEWSMPLTFWFTNI